MTGHTNTVASLAAQAVQPQVISGRYARAFPVSYFNFPYSMDNTIRLWDLVAGKTQGILTHHKKSVRSLAINPNEYTFASGAPDNIKEWKCPDGTFLQNLSGHNAIVNTIAINSDDVMFSGGKKYSSLQKLLNPISPPLFCSRQRKHVLLGLQVGLQLSAHGHDRPARLARLGDGRFRVHV